MFRGKMWKLGAAYGADVRGIFAIKFALLSTLVLMTVGMAVDFTRLSHAKSQMQDAADMAVLLSAKEKTSENKQWQNLGKKAFREQSRQLQFKGEPNVLLQENNGEVFIEASGRLKPQFMQIFGYPKLDVSVDAAVGLSSPSGEKMEVAFVMDFSDSMEDFGKLASAKAAAQSFFDDLQSIQNGDNIKAAIVPFGGTVGVTLPSNLFLSSPYFPDYDGSSANSTLTTCTGDRPYPYNMSDDSPIASNDDTKLGTYAGGYFGWDPSLHCRERVIDKNLIIEPLTTDLNHLKTQLAGMDATIYTHLALGMGFGQHVLSPKAPYTQAASFSDSNVKKKLIFLTDGAQTTPAHTPPGWSGDSWERIYEAKHRMSAVCENLKNQGVEIYVIAYDYLKGTYAGYIEGDEEQVMRACSSGPDYYFQPGYPEEELRAAFEAIFDHSTLGEQYSELRLLR